ncbi:coiled-coil domain-containing protein 146 [Hypomesus transpacificus]|uniref:coiled-coil domain-containing protein 146 n=1 Tax=Hypomesus transpacificus TaxID=137520 RepID=UPI001F082462|nr:coiled-coil domain-containing protein 146 [Hypomesus transpacificus]
MSQAERRSPSPSGGEEGEGLSSEEIPLSALAPDAALPEEGPSTNISASPAFQCLDELFSLGKISGNVLARLKASYSLLHDTLRSSQESEIQLLQQAQRFRAQLEHQGQDLERAETFPEVEETEVGRMRQQLLKFHNDLLVAEERDYQMNYQLECCVEEKACLEKEYEAQPKPVELEKRARLLKESSEELRKEATQRRQEIRSLQEDMQARQRLLQREHRELEDKKEVIDIHQAELAQILSVPMQLSKEIERINRKKTEVERRKAALQEQAEELAALQGRTEARSRALEEERREVMRELDGRRTLLEAADREHNMLLKEQDMNKEKEALLMGQRGVQELNLSHISVERKNVHDSHSRKLRERDRQIRGLKKMEQQLKLANDTLAHTQVLYNKTKCERDALPRGDSNLQRRLELQKEVETLKQKLIHQSCAEVEAQLMERCVEQEQALVRETFRCREELHMLGCLAQIKADEREHKSRELLRAGKRYTRIKQEVMGKSLVIQEHKKQNQEIQARLGVFAKLYDIIKGDRNKCVNLIQMASQRTAEMREKFKILENEMEILRTTVVIKEKLLQKSRLKHIHSRTIRDSLRNDLAQVSWTLQDMSHKRQEQKLDLVELTRIISVHEQNLLQLRKTHDAAVQSRNERGVQLLEREEEMCIFYEKVNVQESLIRDGDVAMQALEEHIRSQQMNISQETRQIHLSRKLLPCKRDLAEESTSLQRQLSECRDQMLELEKALEDPGQENRARVLGGKDPSPVEMIKKIEQLEVRLAEQEELLLEKELVYDQVTRLSRRIRAKAENGKQDTLDLAKKVNELQGRVKEVTRQMMAVVAELSMRQASAMSLQQEVREGELQLDSCQRRLAQGLPPSPELEDQWQKMLREQERRHDASQDRERLKEEEQRTQLPSGVYTTAEARPNAYIPQGDELPLPRPYGGLAPFKPSEPGANIRHVRKPRLKPIEI